MPELTHVRLNAWVGPEEPVEGAVAPAAPRWATRGSFPPSGQVLGPDVMEKRECWDDDRTGWGIVLPENPDPALSAADKAIAADAPDVVQRLVSQRGTAPVFRYDEALGWSHLRRYTADGTEDEPPIGNQIGRGPGKVPLYLLIVGNPTDIPWDLQYALSQRHFVGRLDLDDVGLTNYLAALMDGWAGMHADPGRAVVWSTDFAGDITRDMRTTLAHPLFQALDADAEMTVDYLHDDDATHVALEAALASRPSLVVTTSHGKTGPLDDHDLMAADLGKLVDQNDHVMDIDSLTAGWEPQGAVWYAHACCSAGSRSASRFPDLLAQGSLAWRVVSEVGNLRSQTSPLPRALLGVRKPLRGFVGQVEPTFDWTLRDAQTKQRLTDDIVQSLYNRLMQPWPIGYAFADYYESVGFFTTKWSMLKDQIDEGDEDARAPALRMRLTALDRQSAVLLGDPTAILPALPSKQLPDCTP
jgi:hypothetical protein